jgi:hypothetical protein
MAGGTVQETDEEVASKFMLERFGLVAEENELRLGMADLLINRPKPTTFVGWLHPSGLQSTSDFVQRQPRRQVKRDTQETQKQSHLRRGGCVEGETTVICNGWSRVR